MKVVAALLALLVAGPALAAGHTGHPPLTVYSDRHQTEDAAVFEEFTKATGIPVELALPIALEETSATAAAVEEADTFPPPVETTAAASETEPLPSAV